jgi:hypothetical protein
MNPPPIQNAVDREGKGLSFVWMQWFSQLFPFLQRVTDYTGASIQAPVTGFAIQVADRDFVLTLSPAGTLSAGTITLPANPLDGQPFESSTTQIITSLTVSPSSGQTVYNAPTTLLAGSGFAYYYSLAAKTWYRRY